MNTHGKSVAIAIIDTSQHVLAYNALANSLAAFDFQQVLILSDEQRHWGDHPIVKIPPIKSLDEYNRLVTAELPKHLRTDFCLVIQYDGFIINADQFSPHFYFYDYIGAPWPHFPTMTVGNGGFSWRSRKLMDAVATLPYEDLSMAEDLFICRQQRPLLEKSHNVVFAPPEIAAHFSTESVSTAFPTFGFHGVFHLPQIYRESIDFLVNHIHPSTARKWQHMLLPAVERVSMQAADSLRVRIGSPVQPEMKPT
jgi:hypothetical protein